MNFGDERLPERFWSKCIPEPMSGCWLWMAAHHAQLGYGAFRWEGKQHGAHRVAVLADGRVIPKGMEIDHRCRVRCCVNPAHLDVVTPTENCHRSPVRMAGSGTMAAKTHCPQGHEYSEANTYRWRGKRKCRACWCRRG